MIGVGLLCPSPIPRLPNENAQVAFLLSASTPVNGLGSRCVRRRTKRKDSGGWRRPARLPGNVVLLVVSFVLLCLVMFCPLSFLKYDSLGGIEWNLLSTEWVAVKGIF